MNKYQLDKVVGCFHHIILRANKRIRIKEVECLSVWSLHKTGGIMITHASQTLAFAWTRVGKQ